MNTGTQVGPYEIRSEIGRGGMGVVYLAHDSALDRDVAIKALPPELAQDPDRLARFEREARVLASLDHANVARILGTEEQDGQRYLILEYVAGETLAARLDRGALPVDEALRIAIEIAAGVEAAHVAGVVHRDLKPDNIKVAPDGRVKVLDFGLARRTESDSSTAGPESATLSAPTPRFPTLPGAILGTAPYMSPEQARGQAVDRRTDIWSFGVILHEMLTGDRLFHGETAGDSIGAVLHKEIDLARLPVATPAGARHALWRCLQRERAARYQDLGDVRIELQAAGAGIAPPWATDPGRSAKRAVNTATLLVTTVVLTAALTGGLGWLRGAGPVARVPGATCFNLDLGDDFRLNDGATPCLSADGRRVLLRCSRDEQPCVVVRDLGEPTARVVPNTRAAGVAAISPDGRWVCLIANGVMNKVPVSGGAPIPICPVENTRGCAWSEDGTIIFAPGRTGPLHRVSDQGGAPEPMYEMAEATSRSDRTPYVLPGGKGVLFDRTHDGADWSDCSVMVFPFAGGQPRELVRGARFGRYLRTGHIVYQRKDTLMAVGFDLDRLEATTAEVPVLHGLVTSNTGGGGPPQFDLAPDGTLVYLSGTARSQRERRLETVTLEGSWSPVSQRTGRFGHIWPSPDGRFLAVETHDALGERGASSGIDVLELDRDLMRPVAGGSDRGLANVAWHPDSRSILYGRIDGSTHMSLCRYRVGSAAEVEVLIDHGPQLILQDWSHDGRTLIASKWTDDEVHLDLVLLRFDERGHLESAEPGPFIDWPQNQNFARFSPDDRWVLFLSSDTKAGAQLWVAALDDPARSVQVSVDGARAGCWAPDRDRIYFVHNHSTGATINAVDFTVSEAGEFEPRLPQPVLKLPEPHLEQGLSMTKDGSAFFIARLVEGGGAWRPPQLRVVLNWTEGIRDVLPRAK